MSVQLWWNSAAVHTGLQQVNADLQRLKNRWEFFSHGNRCHYRSHLRSFPFLSIPIPKLESCSDSHGISILTGNPIPMVISTVQRKRIGDSDSDTDRQL